jgi:hypothetical protein
LVGLKKADDHCAPYAAGTQDRGEAFPANFRIVQPKFIQRVPEHFRTASRPGDVDRERGMIPESVLVFVCVQQSERCFKTR